MPSVIKRKISEVIIHEEYGGRKNPFKNNIALIKVDEEIPMAWEDSKQSSIVPVCLPWESSDPGNNLLQNDKLLFTGWGTTENSTETERRFPSYKGLVTQSLQEVTIPFVNDENCNQSPGMSKLMTNGTVICAGGDFGK